MKQLFLPLLFLWLCGSSYRAAAQATATTYYAMSTSNSLADKMRQTADWQMQYSPDGDWFNNDSLQIPAIIGFHRLLLTLPLGEVVISQPFAVNRAFYFRDESEAVADDLLPPPLPKEIIEINAETL
jgi:hypothetical protein